MSQPKSKVFMFILSCPDCLGAECPRCHGSGKLQMQPYAGEVKAGTLFMACDGKVVQLTPEDKPEDVYRKVWESLIRGITN